MEIGADENGNQRTKSRATTAFRRITTRRKTTGVSKPQLSRYDGIRFHIKKRGRTKINVWVRVNWPILILCQVPLSFHLKVHVLLFLFKNSPGCFILQITILGLKLSQEDADNAQELTLYRFTPFLRLDLYICSVRKIKKFKNKKLYRPGDSILMFNVTGTIHLFYSGLVYTLLFISYNQDLVLGFFIRLKPQVSTEDIMT